MAFTSVGRRARCLMWFAVLWVASTDAGADANHRVASFETTFAAEKITVVHGDAKLVAAGDDREGRAVRMETTPGAVWTGIEFRNVPEDVSEMTTLRFWLKGDGDPTHRFRVRIHDRRGQVLTYRVRGPADAWTKHEVRLGLQDTTPNFDPKRIEKMSFAWFAPRKKFIAIIDDLVLLRRRDEWGIGHRKFVVRMFGSQQLDRVHLKETKHFRIWTDTRAATKTFARTLEASYRRVRKMLGLDELKAPLPALVFRTRDAYWSFCERFVGWTRTEARATAGVASATYFATFFQGDGRPAVTHELTHSLVHRVFGKGGGSWLQEGIAVYCQLLEQGKSASRTWASRKDIRSVPLRRLFTIPVLLRHADPGSGETWDRLYAQAASVFEFLLRSESVRSAAEIERAGNGTPYFGERLQALTKLDVTGDRLLGAIESVYGRSIEALEQDWRAWTAQPPEPRWK